ncbi:MAG: serine hydrolase [Planctomycetota bacterium]
MRTRSTLLALTLAPTLCAQGAKEPPADAKQQLGAFFDAAAARGLFRGVVLVADEGKVFFERAVGDADVGRATTVDAPFYLASISKQFTAAAIMVLAQQGRLGYDDTLATFLPELPAWAETMTLRHLLTHTSGLGNFLSADLTHEGLTNDTVVAHLKTLEATELPPGERYRYSNSAYLLLARVVERVAQTSFRAFTTKEIFEPLGMSTAVFNDETRPSVPNRVVGFDRYGQESDVPHLTNGAGGMFGSARDLWRWHQALFGAQLLRRETLDEAWAPMPLNDGSRSDYGFGWHVHPSEKGLSLHHTGSLAGFRHFVFADLAHERVVIMLTNGGDAFPLPQMATAVTNILRGRPATVPKPALIDHLFAFAGSRPNGLNAEVQRVMAEAREDYRVSEDDLNELGYALLARERTDAATCVFKAAVDAYPASANVYDSYGEALMRGGNDEAAAANYRKSLELDPTNDNATEMLRRLAQRLGQSR